MPRGGAALHEVGGDRHEQGGVPFVGEPLLAPRGRRRSGAARCRRGRLLGYDKA